MGRNFFGREGMNNGCVCVSIQEQNTARQKVLMQAFAVDEVIAESISWLARNTKDLLELVEYLTMGNFRTRSRAASNSTFAAGRPYLRGKTHTLAT